MTTQPTTEQLADELENTPFQSTRYEAAAKMRCLETANEELLEALEKIRAIELQMYGPDWEEINIDRSVIEQALEWVEAQPEPRMLGAAKIINSLREALAAPQPQPVQEPLAWQSIESMAAERYKVVLSHQSMFYRYAVVAGNGAQQLYIGRETECANMARKFAGAFLDGAHVVRYLNNTSPQAQPLSDDASPIFVLLAVEESIKNGECPWQIEQAFDEYEAQRQSEITKGTT